MTKNRPLNENELESLRRSVEGSIRKAFAHVRRDGGVSWNEATIIDDYGAAAQRAQARLLDTDTRWEQLVDDPLWYAHHTASNFSFLDDVGRRYYLPALMVRAMRNRDTVCLRYDLRVPPAYLNEAQTRATARFIHYMIQRGRCDEQGDAVAIESAWWSELLQRGWDRLINEPNG